MRLNTSIVRVHVIGALLVFGPALPAAADPPGVVSAIQPAERESSVHVDNFARINSGYYRGGQPKASDFADLAALGVRTVINLTSDDARADEQAMVERVGMRYVGIPMHTRIVPTPAQIAEFLRIVNDPARRPVYVHCVGGRHRTGVMTAIYRMSADRWTPEQAFAEMKRFKFGADFLHPEFKQFVFAFQAPVVAITPAVTAAAAPPAAAKKE